MTADIKHISYADHPLMEYRTPLSRLPVLCGKKVTQRHVRPFKTAERAGTCKECQATRMRVWGF